MTRLLTLLLSSALSLEFITAPVGACLSQEFTCSQGLCVPKDRECDFTDNCGDGSDEEDCSRYKRCDFEETGLCDLIQTSGWTRTTEVPGLKHDHTNSTSAHFLSLSPVRGNTATADLSSPVFLPSQTCQMSFYHYSGAKHGALQVLVQTLDESTEMWKHSTQPRMETWQQTVIQFSSNHSFQVVIQGQLSADSEASEVLAIDDLSFSPGCLTVPGTATINNISLHRRDKFRP
ncbi:hypothetical protein L3Q82_004649 [Scortum barcoo]|uniref:Uncharacterized protein n=1 Tax=Scortum barcoo TaxID=214431 RepID=A0ACB8VGY8_9TELE|nr:hypothetical protein L3Q82_004649 [Scortum barcoo]